MLNGFEWNFDFNKKTGLEVAVFPDITKFKAFMFSEDFQEPTADHNFAELVRNEMRIAPELKDDIIFE